jgi:hypothetical protein
MSADCPTSLYRHFAADGSLLYVGISLSWPTRTKAHAASSGWFGSVAKVEIEHLPSREAALTAEREAIRRERPRFNIIHNRADSNRRSFSRMSRTGVANSHLDKWVRVGSTIRDYPAPACIRCLRKQRGAKWFNLERGEHLCLDCYNSWRRTILPKNSIKGDHAAGTSMLLNKIKGPHAIVGPALVYRAELVSVMVVHGEFGTAGELTEIVLGKFFGEIPAWTQACASVLTIRRGNEITIDEAREVRREIVKSLGLSLGTVQAFDTDLAFAVAYASQFPSKKSRRILDEVAVERGVAA